MKSFRLYKSSGGSTPRIYKEHIEILRGWLKKVGLLPEYTEISLFLILVSVSITLISSQEAWVLFVKLITNREDGSFVFLFLSIGFVIFTLYYTFNFKKTPSKFAKYIMLFSVIIIEILVFWLLFSTTVVEQGLYSKIISFFYISHAILLFLLLNYEIIDIREVSSKNAKPAELILGSILVIIVYIVSSIAFNFHWINVFATMVGYSLIFNNMITPVLHKFFYAR